MFLAEIGSKHSIYLVGLMPISNLISDLITKLISNFGTASMLIHTINFAAKLKFMVWFNMEAIPKSDIKSDIRFDISIKPTTWIL